MNALHSSSYLVYTDNDIPVVFLELPWYCKNKVYMLKLQISVYFVVQTGPKTEG